MQHNNNINNSWTKTINMSTLRRKRRNSTKRGKREKNIKQICCM